jgi:hypothetical protein
MPIVDLNAKVGLMEAVVGNKGREQDQQRDLLALDHLY